MDCTAGALHCIENGGLPDFEDWWSKIEGSCLIRQYEEPVNFLPAKTAGLPLACAVLIAYRSYSRLLAFEASRILFRLGCDVRIYDPSGLPVKDDVQHSHPKVQELRDLSKWSDGHIWVSPEQHGNLVSAFGNFNLYRCL